MRTYLYFKMFMFRKNFVHTYVYVFLNQICKYADTFVHIYVNTYLGKPCRYKCFVFKYANMRIQ
jgi:hypothetical protein